MLRSFVVLTICLFVMIGNLSCSCDHDATLRYEKKLFAPLSAEDISLLVQNCDSKKELLERCGTPLRVEKHNEVESIEFLVSFDKIQRSSPLMIASFVVIVSNDTVMSWHPRSKGRML